MGKEPRVYLPFAPVLCVMEVPYLSRQWAFFQLYTLYYCENINLRTEKDGSVEEHLPRVCKVLVLIPNTKKKKIQWLPRNLESRSF